MKIEINNSIVFDVYEKCLIVKNGKLYNTNTNEYEAIEGDKITFCSSTNTNSETWIHGTVENYTCNRRVKLKGICELYAIKLGTKKIIQHLSSITDTDYEGDDSLEETESEWELILSE